MDPSGALRLHGGLGSPNKMKMRAYLRYRRIPHRFCQMTEMNEEVVRRVRPAVIPVLEWPDGRVANDSTLLIDALEGARVVKGGSYVCSQDYCFRYRPAALQPGPTDTGGSHIGFRTVKRGLEP